MVQLWQLLGRRTHHGALHGPRWGRPRLHLKPAWPGARDVRRNETGLDGKFRAASD